MRTDASADVALVARPDQREASFGRWRDSVRAQAASAVDDFVSGRCAELFDGVPDAEVLERVVVAYVRRGKYFRSSVLLAGWLTVPDSPASVSAEVAVRAAASMELLHCFALLQDDVMDGSPLRRGVPAAHVEFARWHADTGLLGSSPRFGESAATLAGDLCLVWADQLLRTSGMGGAALARVLPRYDRLRSELAVGQFRDLVNEARREPALSAVRSVAQAKSGNYTIRGPLELGADMAGAPPAVLADLGRFGEAIGEAFQLRDDLLGLFGAPEVTGKPVGEDLYARKATYVLVLARDLAGPAARRELARLTARAELTAADVARCLEIITETGARAHTERYIADRLATGLAAIEHTYMPGEARDRLGQLARLCVDRVH
jgi:geranylgeranyl diphosphate synthase type I